MHILGCDKYVSSQRAFDFDRNLSGCYLDDDQNWLPVIGTTNQRIAEYVSRCTDNLEKLTIRFTAIRNLDLGHLTGMQQLDLAHNEQLNQVEGLERLHELHILYLYHTFMGPQLDLSGNAVLRGLIIDNTKISRITTCKGIIAFSPLSQGLLTDRYLKGIPADSRIMTDGRFLKENALTEERLNQIRQLNELAAQRGQTLAQMALSWILRDGIVTSVLAGASKPDQILDNIKAAQNTTFTAEEISLIDKFSL